MTTIGPGRTHYHQQMREVRGEILMMGSMVAKAIDRATQLLWAAHNLERIADRVTNVCERTAYVITGNPRALPGKVEPD